MDRAIPEFNRPIADRQKVEAKRQLRDRLKQVKPGVDNSLPTSMMHPIVKLKKE
jgi:hypothetical protein